jgi:hypothetical protein
MPLSRPPLRRLSSRLSRGAAAIALSAAAAVLAPAAQAQNAPSPVETEFWRSAQRIDTPDAYRAFLAAFPASLYAPLAKAAIDKPPAAAVAAPAAAAPPASATSALRTFSRPVESQSVTLKLGDRLTGPGYVWVGRAGTAKQVALPPGEWVLLSVVEGKSVQSFHVSGFLMAPRPMEVVRIAFGRFVGARLASLMQTTLTVSFSNVPDWTDVVGCDRGEALRLRHQRGSQGVRDECVSARSSANPLAELADAESATRDTLNALGAQVSGAALVSTLSYGEKVRGYLGLTRLDWPGVTLGAAADDASLWTPTALASIPAHQAYAAKASAWLDRWRQTQRDGYLRNLDGEELTTAGAKAPAAAAMADF